MKPFATRRHPVIRAAHRPRRHSSALLLTCSLLSMTGCSAAAGRTGPEDGGTAGASPPPMKQTCSDVTWEPAPSLHVVQTGRKLIGFSPTVLGVESTWVGDGFTATTVAGGYVDDLTEAFDDLRLTGSLTVGGGVQAEVLQGRLLKARVLAVVWRDPAEDVPCDVHALVVTGADAAQEEEALRGLE